MSRITHTLKALAVAAIGSLLAFNAAAQSAPSTIRIGSTAPGHLKFILAQHHGSFEKEFAKEGIKFDLLPFTGGGSEAVTALATGAVEIAYIGNNPALRAAAQKANIKLVGTSSFVRNSGAYIIVPVNSPIKTLKDLKGKKVAYLAGTVRHSTLTKALKSVGLTSKDIESLNLPFEASGPALARGDIDAIVESDNVAATLLEKNAARILLDAGNHPEWAAPNVIVVNGDFAKKYPEVLKRVLKVDLQLATWADANYEETVKIFTTRTKSSEKAVRNNFKDGRFHQEPRLTDEVLAALKAEEEFMEDAGLLKGSVDYSKWVDKSFVESAYAGAAAAAKQ
ncbi:aliphatic sulfonate ABC transporter substrate-binding protein [Uliginosibacterium sp. H1]|uniref:aliphatic sulfonate ABC transporter substrate-binding protein n=1 Tax=Uliginosibacterium sp. H1 TaxID=3114757 RepID=UPI002E16E068|nr:aliphatic sulfonate ABC transporter substrate-binding protein [Uliginosibacterium sp. H1]